MITKFLKQLSVAGLIVGATVSTSFANGLENFNFYARGAIGAAISESGRSIWGGGGNSGTQGYAFSSSGGMGAEGAVGIMWQNGLSIEALGGLLVSDTHRGRGITGNQNRIFAQDFDTYFLGGQLLVRPMMFAGDNDWPIQPFVGGGVGAAFHDVDSMTRNNATNGNLQRVWQGDTSTSFAWFVTAGLEAKIEPQNVHPFYVQVFYRYTDAGTAKGGTLKTFGGGGNPSLNNPPKFDVEVHSVMAGLTIPF